MEVRRGIMLENCTHDDRKRVDKGSCSEVSESISVMASRSTLCYQCGEIMEFNPVYTCINCIRLKHDITEKLNKSLVIYHCRSCDRYLTPPATWTKMLLESKELLSYCLARIFPPKHELKLVDANFIWTEPHSKVLKVAVCVQGTVFEKLTLEQKFVSTISVHNQMCHDCNRIEAKDYWNAVVQIRQKVDHKKTFFHLEQLILRHKAHENCSSIILTPHGIDFYYGQRNQAVKMMEFVARTVTGHSVTSQKLISSDPKNNTYNYKYTFLFEIIPICREDVVCVSPSFQRKHGLSSQLLVCLKVIGHIKLIDPFSSRVVDLDSEKFYREPFHSVCTSKQLTQFQVVQIEFEQRHCNREVGKFTNISLWLSKLNSSDGDCFHTRSHIGHLLREGDTVAGFDLRHTNANNDLFNSLDTSNLHEIIIVKKIFGKRSLRKRQRKWKLQRLAMEIDQSVDDNSQNVDKAIDEFESFLEDLEEDVEHREGINLYKRPVGELPNDDSHPSLSNEEIPLVPLEELLEQLTI